MVSGGDCTYHRDHLMYRIVESLYCPCKMNTTLRVNYTWVVFFLKCLHRKLRKLCLSKWFLILALLRPSLSVLPSPEELSLWFSEYFCISLKGAFHVHQLEWERTFIATAIKNESTRQVFFLQRKCHCSLENWIQNLRLQSFDPWGLS